MRHPLQAAVYEESGHVEGLAVGRGWRRSSGGSGGGSGAEGGGAVGLGLSVGGKGELVNREK